jgi:hypothetical protein
MWGFAEIENKKNLLFPDCPGSYRVKCTEYLQKQWKKSSIWALFRHEECVKFLRFLSNIRIVGCFFLPLQLMKIKIHSLLEH